MATKKKFIVPKIYARNRLEITEVLNEQKMIHKIINDSDAFIDSGNLFTALRLMAKHCYFNLGYRKKKTLDYLDDFLDKNYPIYNKGDYEKEIKEESCTYKTKRNGFFSYYGKTFNMAYNLAEKSIGICNKDGFWITQSELNHIEKLNNKVLERLAFVFLCYAKLYKMRNPKANGWVYNGKYKDIFLQARIACSVFERYIYIAELEDRRYLQLFQMPERARDSIYKFEKYQKRKLDSRVVFIDDDSEPVIYINDFRELGYYYKQYKGENIIKCNTCGKLTRGNKNNTKMYCRTCAGTEKKYKVMYTFCRCIDCGKVFVISDESNERKRKRCDDCKQKERKLHNQKMYQQRKLKNSTK